MANWRVALEVLLLAVLLTCSPAQSSVCSGIVTSITNTAEGECAISGIDRLTTIANDSFEVVKYQWKIGAPQEETDRQCVCGFQLILQLNNGNLPSSLCTEKSPIDCSSFCEAESLNQTNCQSYINSTCEFSCIIKSTNGTVVALMADLGCDVLRRYTRNICPNIFQSFNTTTPVPTSPDTPDGNEEIALSVGLTLGVVGTTIVAVTACCIWYACHQRSIQLARRSVPEQPAISMTENIGYHSSTPDVSIVSALNPAYAISSEPDHIYEELPEDVTIETETSTTQGKTDKGHYYYVNNELHPEGRTNNPRRKGNNSDKYDAMPIGSLPESVNPAQTSDITGNKKIRDTKDYYVINDLFPEEAQATAQRKEDSYGSIGQNRNDQPVDMAEEKSKRSHGEETDGMLDEDEYLKVEG